MLISTKLFGDIDIEQEKIICFQEGIIGFPDLKHFTLIADEGDEKTSNIYWLQSVDEGIFALPVIDPLLIIKDYDPLVEEELLKPIGGIEEGNMSVFVTITVPAQVEQMTVNLKAPIIINSRTTKACQLIIEDDAYQVRYPVYDMLKARKEKAGE